MLFGDKKYKRALPGLFVFYMVLLAVCCHVSKCESCISMRSESCQLDEMVQRAGLNPEYRARGTAIVWPCPFPRSDVIMLWVERR